MNMIPITFLTGFYVTQVVARYWDQFMSLPWPDRIALKIVTHIPGKVGTKYRLKSCLVYNFIHFSVNLRSNFETNCNEIRKP